MTRARHYAATAFAALAILSIAPLPAGAADTQSPVGRWQTTTGESRYEVSYCGGTNLCARLTWLRSDARTPENLDHLNTFVVKNARQTGANKWSGTVSYDGEEIPGRLILIDDDSLMVRGCQVIFCQTMEFERI
ncbi:MAG: DUF2147 domain-containing protein [Alphaproteobacteria bacterium]|nr:DUF2147 domain-containing protein [Alphaproteobacteria bacterium]